MLDDGRMTMKVYLDDERQTPEGWWRVYWPEEAIALLKQGNVSEISLDHDLGDDEHGTGYDVVLWIEEEVATRGFHPPKIYVHSANTSARQKMERGIANIRRLSSPL
ncbi:cyclic-phosphate processing receiver domain-containing protein [Vibrio astriarenae]